MATVSNAYVSQNIMVGPADVYIGIPSPTSHIPPTQADEIAIDASGQPASASTAVTAATNATPIVVTLTNFSGYTPSNNDIVVITGVTGNTNANGTWSLKNVVVAGTTTATLLGSAGNSAYVSGGTAVVGQHLGLLEGPLQLNITPKFVEVRADQYESPVDAALTIADAELDATMLEFDLPTVQRWFMADSFTNPAVLANSTVLQVGGTQNSAGDAVNLRTMMFVAGNRTNVGKWIYAFAFQVYLKSAIQLTFDRTGKNAFKLKFGVTADTSRVAGDEFLHIVKTK